jgi:SAM-dependent methyltransferase
MERAESQGTREALKRSVVAHYEARLREHGPTARGMDWKDERSQRLRFAMLVDGLELAGRSLHDVGCGSGELCAFLRERGLAVDYRGSDLSAEMIAAARARQPGVSFQRADLLADELAPADVLVTSGLFHVKLAATDAEWSAFVRDMLRRMFGLAREAIAFNLMSDQVDFRVPELHYSSPAETLAFCQRELSRHVRLRHDYPLHEYTVHVLRGSKTTEAQRTQRSTEEER